MIFHVWTGVGWLWVSNGIRWGQVTRIPRKTDNTNQPGDHAPHECLLRHIRFQVIQHDVTFLGFSEVVCKAEINFGAFSIILLSIQRVLTVEMDWWKILLCFARVTLSEERSSPSVFSYFSLFLFSRVSVKLFLVQFSPPDWQMATELNARDGCNNYGIVTSP